MDVTPKLLEDVEFREKFRGYDPEEVDEFLERVSIAFGQLQERVRDLSEQVESANGRAARAEARARDSSDADDTLRRTLVLAQRTADAAIKEAEENAAAIIAAAEAQARQHYAAAEEKAAQAATSADEEVKAKLARADEQAADKQRQADAHSEATLANAREQASRLLVDARQKADKLLADAETTAVRQAQEKLDRLTDECAQMERRRDALAHDVNALDAHGVVQRERLRAALDQLRGIIEAPAALGDMPLPQLGSVSFDGAVAAHVARAAAPAAAAPADAPATPAEAPAAAAPATPSTTDEAVPADTPAEAPAAASTPASAAASDAPTGPGTGSVFDSSAAPAGAVSTSPFAPGAARVSRDPVGRDDATVTTAEQPLIAPVAPSAEAPAAGVDTAGSAVSADPTTPTPAPTPAPTTPTAGGEVPAVEAATAAGAAAPADAAAGDAPGDAAEAGAVSDDGAPDGDRPSTVPPRARAAADRPSMGLGTPGAGGSGDSNVGSGAPPWMGMVPPPPPPPRPPGRRRRRRPQNRARCRPAAAGLAGERTGGHHPAPGRHRRPGGRGQGHVPRGAAPGGG
ncbi:MAG: DivIVA domain-containing protein [Acidimicrobiales bacterium]